MSDVFEITREIGIDAGHRVPDHASKCYSLHGHRYKIQATCVGELADVGEETGMVMDFGFLKELMMEEIDEKCDHAMILWKDDPWLGIMQNAYDEFDAVIYSKIYIMPDVPTAENLARHWFAALAPRVVERSQGRATLSQVRVWETPNCMATYPPIVRMMG